MDVGEYIKRSKGKTKEQAAMLNARHSAHSSAEDFGYLYLDEGGCERDVRGAVDISGDVEWLGDKGLGQTI